MGYRNATRVLYVNDYGASWQQQPESKTVNRDQLISMCMIPTTCRNVYVSVGGKVFRQVVGIPMGTNCAPFLANLFLYALEFKYMEKLAKRDIMEARKLSDCFRFIDDLFCLNHGEKLAEAKHEIYPTELCLRSETNFGLKSTGTRICRATCTKSGHMGS